MADHTETNRMRRVLDKVAKAERAIKIADRRCLTLDAEKATEHWNLTARYLSNIRYFQLQIKAIEKQLKEDSN